MSYPSIIYNVMIASPGDVQDERDAARAIIYDWNNINSPSRKIALLPLTWEFNSIPTMGERPQQIINKQVLNNADLLIGIFWTRVGTPTGKAISGTVEEIEEHIKSGKPTMLYFSNTPVVPSSIDQEQYNTVKKLESEYRTKGLTDTFQSIDDFKTKFSRHLAMKLNSDSYFKSYNDDISTQLEDKNNGDSGLISISKEAKDLIIEASADPTGTVVRISYSGGFDIQTNNKSFVTENSPRSIALWQSALEELERLGYLNAVNYKREIFRVTNDGYLFAESLS